MTPRRASVNFAPQPPNHSLLQEFYTLGAFPNSRGLLVSSFATRLGATLALAAVSAALYGSKWGRRILLVELAASTGCLLWAAAFY